MAQTNQNKTRAPARRTYEGGRGMPQEAPLAALQRVLNAHLLWEDSFYIDGKSAADQLDLAVLRAANADAQGTAEVILRARTAMKIRHASLRAAVAFARRNPVPGMARHLIRDVIERADELAEVLSMAGPKGGMSHAIRKGVADAFGKFDEYQFGKYRGEGKSVTLRDAVFLTHPNPEKLPLVQKIVDGTLATPDTWETNLSAGADKRETFTRLMAENRLGAMALLRNLRGMLEAGVCSKDIAAALEKANWARVLPFRFVSAAKAAPALAKPLDTAFKLAVAGSVYLPGSTAVLVDTSASMDAPLSTRSTVPQHQAGAALAAAINGDEVRLFQWADHCAEIPNFGSLSNALAIRAGYVGHGTQITQAIAYANRVGVFDRIIVISDMQFSDAFIGGLQPGQRGYAINTSPYAQPGLMLGNWTHFSGFSEQVLKYIAAAESVTERVDEEA